MVAQKALVGLPYPHRRHTFQPIDNTADCQCRRIVNQKMDMVSILAFHHFNREVRLFGNVEQYLLHVVIDSIDQQPLPVFGHENDVGFEQELAVGITFVFFLFLCHFFTSETPIYYIRCWYRTQWKYEP